MVLDSEGCREILIFLAERPRAAGEIAVSLERSRSGVSQHLSNLLGANLIACDQRGSQRIYSVRAAQALAAFELWLEGAP